MATFATAVEILWQYSEGFTQVLFFEIYIFGSTTT